jgi:hypothetical protein
MNKKHAPRVNAAPRSVTDFTKRDYTTRCRVRLRRVSVPSQRNCNSNLRKKKQSFRETVNGIGLSMKNATKDT